MSNAAESDDRKALKYRQFIKAAVRAFSRSGYHRCTMKEVAKEAGVADGTLYLYFDGKKDLLVKCFNYVMEVIITKVDDDLSKLDNPVDKLRKIMDIHFEVMESDSDLAGFMQFQLRQPDLEMREPILPRLKDYAGRIEMVIDEGKEKGVFRNDLGTRAMRRVVFGSMDETVSAWWFRRDKERLAPKASPLMDTILDGIKV